MNETHEWYFMFATLIIPHLKLINKGAYLLHTNHKLNSKIIFQKYNKTALYTLLKEVKCEIEAV